MFTILEQKILATAQSMGANVTSDDLDAKTIVSLTIACVVSAESSPVGNMILQVLLVESGTYRDHTSIAITGDGDTIFEILDPSGLNYRVFYERTSGSATLDIELSARVHKRGNAPDVEVL